MDNKRKIRKYVKVSSNPRMSGKKKLKPKKKMPIRGGKDQEHFDKSTYYDLGSLKFRSPNIQNFCNLQLQSPSVNGLETIFEEALEGFLYKSPFARDDVAFFRYGVFFRSPVRIPSKTLRRIKEAMISSKGTLSVIQEQRADALLVRFGNNNKIIDADDIIKGLQRQEILIESIYDLLSEYGDVYWGLEFETEEAFY